MSVTESTREVDFTEPASLEEARARSAALMLDIEKIQRQLGAGRTDLSGQEAKDWRHRARTAMDFKQAERRYLKEWIHQHSQSERSERPRAVIDLTTVQLAALMVGRVKRLEKLYESVLELIKDDSDEAWERVVSRAENVSKDEVPSG